MQILSEIKLNVKGYLLLDGDNRNLPEHELSGDGFAIGRWVRYEAESYLVHPEALLRFVEKELPLFVEAARQYLHDELPGAVFRGPMGDHDYLNNTPASKALLPGFLKAAGIDLPKSEYFEIAKLMRPDEVAPEVKQKLDDIAKVIELPQ